MLNRPKVEHAVKKQLLLKVTPGLIAISKAFFKPFQVSKGNSPPLPPTPAPVQVEIDLLVGRDSWLLTICIGKW
jgi:hypothetical protein